MSESPPRIGKVQYQIMQALWKQGRATARQITEEIIKQRIIEQVDTDRFCRITNSTLEGLAKVAEAEPI